MVAKSVKPSGGDYTSLDTALATEAGDLSSIGPIDFEIWTFPGGLDEEVGIYQGDGWTNASAVNRILITAAAGESFVDAGPATPLYWDTAFAHVDKSSNYQNTIDIDVNYVTLSRLMIGHSGGFNGRVIKDLLNHTSIDQCIVYGTQGNLVLIDIGGSSGVMQRSVVILDNDGNGSALYFSGGEVSNVTAVRPSGLASAGLGIRRQFGTPVAKNCAAFGFEQDFAGTWAGGTDYNASGDATAPGAGSLTSIVFADQFENAANDFRTKATGDLQAGTSTGTPATDIFGTAQPTPYWIGAHVPASGAIEGAPADLTASPALDAAAGSTGWTGAPADATAAVAFDQPAGALVFTGNPDDPAIGPVVDTVTGAVLVSGAPAGLASDVALDPAIGTVGAFAGDPADLAAAVEIDQAPGTVSGAGTPADLVAAPEIDVAAGIFTVPAGMPADLTAAPSIDGTAGGVAWTGAGADLSTAPSIDQAAGTVSVTGLPDDLAIAPANDNATGTVAVAGNPDDMTSAIEIGSPAVASGPVSTDPDRTAAAPASTRTAAATALSRRAEAA
ncbi:hypothetical protein [Oceanibacterium hippocampi]|uniref:Uncharacterized protein n=1 Tax=Oceanibacterium hippocampi TaxID=745714 RepID=A0A1Y5SWZ6_9PROT|nr:hypothetical protein [Oceanibacterium hippocampi]SLN50347.1 hypothetical protein OCH7691_02218 [Oceanibacterium hippocampi]